jgi:MerR HTH family regulatory protein
MRFTGAALPRQYPCYLLSLASVCRPGRGPRAPCSARPAPAAYLLCWLLPQPGMPVVTAPWADPAHGGYNISVAAELARLHPQTLRIYEREGLLQPARSVGGTRRYSQNDITRLLEISTLSSEGLNLAGIRRVLAL